MSPLLLTSHPRHIAHSARLFFRLFRFISSLALILLLLWAPYSLGENTFSKTAILSIPSEQSSTPDIPTEWNTMLKIGFAVGAAAVLGLLLIAAKLDSPRSLNFALVISGGAAGWALGILVSPYPNESSRFSEYGKAISTFLSGFVLAKLSPLFQYAIHNKLLQPNVVWLTRALLFVGSFFLFVLFVFVTRTYVPSGG